MGSHGAPDEKFFRSMVPPVGTKDRSGRANGAARPDTNPGACQTHDSESAQPNYRTCLAEVEGLLRARAQQSPTCGPHAAECEGKHLNAPARRRPGSARRRCPASPLARLREPAIETWRPAAARIETCFPNGRVLAQT